MSNVVITVMWVSPMFLLVEGRTLDRNSLTPESTHDQSLNTQLGSAAQRWRKESWFPKAGVKPRANTVALSSFSLNVVLHQWRRAPLPFQAVVYQREPALLQMPFKGSGTMACVKELNADALPLNPWLQEEVFDFFDHVLENMIKKIDQRASKLAREKQDVATLFRTRINRAAYTDFFRITLADCTMACHYETEMRFCSRKTVHRTVVPRPKRGGHRVSRG
ncbi:hypothetical protein EVAR_57688_1 [Eumeta japonica]|uniref:Uncharacterized protein n=1 Tax=Eumeta variegata TaxID=151549 RepID=A0A4C1Y8R1_EUMVA|nr:hypothetical protein EVAR_57688_1 [Eumeta japonica]